MISLSQWAQRWRVPPQALRELRELFGTKTDPEPQDRPPRSEAAVQQQARLKATQAGGRLWRNNVGALHTAEGAYIRYGICNDSQQLNKRIKSSDLIGIRPLLITAAHVGQTLGQFEACECKPEGWKYSGTAREVAQRKFIELVVSLGGHGRFQSTT